MIEAVVERCAGIDVGKKFVLVCVMTGAAKDEPKTKIKKFGTIVSELDIAYWSKEFGVTGDQLHEAIRSHGTHVEKIRAALHTHKGA